MVDFAPLIRNLINCICEGAISFGKFPSFKICLSTAIGLIPSINFSVKIFKVVRDYANKTR